jgi:hypothetical protein
VEARCRESRDGKLARWRRSPKNTQPRFGGAEFLLDMARDSKDRARRKKSFLRSYWELHNPCARYVIARFDIEGDVPTSRKYQQRATECLRLAASALLWAFDLIEA